MSDVLLRRRKRRAKHEVAIIKVCLNRFSTGKDLEASRPTEGGSTEL